MKKVLSIAILNLLGLLCFNLNGQESCGDIPCDPSIESDVGCNHTGSSNVKIYFHIYRNNDGEGGQPPSRITECIDNLNNAFSSTGISFYFNSCETRYVDDTRLWEYDGRPFCDIFFTSASHDDGIDIHLLSDNLKGRAYAGRACHIPGKELLIGGKRDGVPGALSTGIPHEMGHCFGLFHTHHQQSPGFSALCPSGTSNWLFDYESGDYVSDTPPDPGGESVNCNYNFSFAFLDEACDDIDNDSDGIVDEDNDFDVIPFPGGDGTVDFTRPCFTFDGTPQVDNYLSYYGEICRASFTPCQISRMHNFMPSGITGTPDSQMCCGDFTLDDGSDVDDLVSLLSLPSIDDLSSAGGNVFVMGTFTIDKSIDLRGPLNFFMGPGATIRVTNNARFGKVGGFITKCSQSWNSIRVESQSDIYLYDVEVSGANTAVTILGSTGTVQSSKIYGCTSGIYMGYATDVLIDNTEIDCSYSGVSAYQESSTVISKCRIGYASEPVYSIYVQSSSADIVDNTILTDYTAIYTVGATDTKVYHNTIETRDWQYGMIIFNSDTEVLDNTINMNDSRAAILSSSNTSSNVYRNNAVTGSGEAGIRLDASTNQTILANNITNSLFFGKQGDLVSRGINLFSSDGNTITCNNIIAEDFGLSLYSFSDLQDEIATNTFPNVENRDAEMDFYSESEFGRHQNLGNIEWEDAECTVLSDFARFEVSSDDPIDGWVPTLGHWAPQELFQEAGSNDEACSGIVGPRPFNPDWICLYVDSLVAKRQNDFTGYWVNRYHLIRRYLNYVPWHEWPPCITEGCLTPEDCCMEKLAQAQHKVHAALQSISEGSNTITSIDSTSSENDRANIRASRNQWSSLSRSILISVANEVQEELDEIDCTDSLITVWKETYRIVVKDMVGEITENDMDYLQDVATLCPDDYGDPVLWARGLLAGKIPHYNATSSDCNNDLEPRENIIVRKRNDEARLYPNPANHSVTLELKNWENTRIRLTDVTGTIVRDLRAQSSHTLVNTSTLGSGIYFFEINHPDRDTQIEKVIINH